MFPLFFSAKLHTLTVGTYRDMQLGDNQGGNSYEK